MPTQPRATRAVLRAAPRPASDREPSGPVRALHVQMAYLAPTLDAPPPDAVAAPDRSAGSGPSAAGAPADGLDVASIAFDVPPSMLLERRSLIQLALGTGQPARADGLARTAAEAPQRLARYVEARLSGGDFLIEAVTADAQALGGDNAAEWLWLVTPKKPGKQQLHLTVTALDEAGSARQRRVLPTIKHTVHVGVAWQDAVRRRAAAHKAWLWAALALAPLALLWPYMRWRRRRRRWFHGGL